MNYDYNTKREEMVMPEYGRNIHKMIKHACGIENKEERNKAARTIIAIMANLNPGLRDHKQKLWDHLAIMSDFKLDVDSPFEKPSPKVLKEKPKKVMYNNTPIHYKHYGRVIENMIKTAIEMEEGEKKEAFIEIIANHMKKCYLTWNKPQVTDEVIFKDLRDISGGKLNVPPDTRLSESREILAKNKKKKLQRKKQG